MVKNDAVKFYMQFCHDCNQVIIAIYQISCVAKKTPEHSPGAFTKQIIKAVKLFFSRIHHFLSAIHHCFRSIG